MHNEGHGLTTGKRLRVLDPAKLTTAERLRLVDDGFSVPFDLAEYGEVKAHLVSRADQWADMPETRH